MVEIFDASQFNEEALVNIAVQNYNRFIQECINFIYVLATQQDPYRPQQQHLLSMLGSLITKQVFIKTIVSCQNKFVIINIRAIQNLCDQIICEKTYMTQNTFGDLYNLLRICAHINNYNKNVNDILHYEAREFFRQRDPNFTYLYQALFKIAEFIIKYSNGLDFLSNLYFDKIMIQIMQIEYIPFVIRYYFFTQFVYNMETKVYTPVITLQPHIGVLNLQQVFFDQFMIFIQYGMNNQNIEQLSAKNIENICYFAIETVNNKVYDIIVDLTPYYIDININQIFLYLIQFINNRIQIQINRQMQRKAVVKYLEVNSDIQEEHLEMLETIFKYEEIFRYDNEQVFDYLFNIINNNRCKSFFNLELHILQILASIGYDFTNNQDFIVFIQRKAEQRYNSEQQALFNNIMTQIDAYYGQQQQYQYYQDQDQNVYSNF